MDISIYSFAKDLVRATIGLYNKWRGHVESKPQQEFLTRFIRVFENQGIQRAQIGRVLSPKFQLKPVDLLDNNRLMNVIDESILSHVAEQFGVKRAWLDGTQNSIYSTHCVYKHPEQFVELLAEMKKAHDEIWFWVIKGMDNNLDKKSGEGRIAAFLRGSITTLDNETIWRDYLLDDGWKWSHPRSRTELKTLCLIAWQFDLTPFCRSAKQVDIDKFLNGNFFCGELLKVTDGTHWHLDDYIFTSDESAMAKDNEEALLARENLLKHERASSALHAMTGQTKLKLLD